MNAAPISDVRLNYDGSASFLLRGRRLTVDNPPAGFDACEGIGVVENGSVLMVGGKHFATFTGRSRVRLVGAARKAGAK